jgi:hypothetical protein
VDKHLQCRKLAWSGFSCLAADMVTLAHVFNPVQYPKPSAADFAQQVALRSILAARKLAPQPVELVSVQYAEDRAAAPDEFTQTPDLTRSVLDFGSFQPPRKLPLVADMLEEACQATAADYLIYTNNDIGVQPYFYEFIGATIEAGSEAFTINRRSIPASFSDPAELPKMYAELGEPHRGWDCFIFPREAYRKFILHHVCAGAPLMGLALLANMQAFCSTFQELRGLHLTFHLGNERGWTSRRQRAYFDHNRQQLRQVLAELEEGHGVFPASTPPGRYLRFHRSPLAGKLYDYLFLNLYLPARWTRRER